MPNPGPPRLRAIDDPVNHAWCARMVQISLARQGLVFADLRAPDVEHVKAA
jgi:hypothetical protein